MGEECCSAPLTSIQGSVHSIMSAGGISLLTYAPAELSLREKSKQANKKLPLDIAKSLKSLTEANSH